MWHPPELRSPDGAVEVAFSAEEMRMSLWVHEPLVRRLRDQAVVLDLTGTLWDAAAKATFPAPGRVAFNLRHYPDGSTVVPVVVDVEAETFGIGDEEPGRSLRGIREALRAARKQIKGRRQAGDHS